MRAHRKGNRRYGVGFQARLYVSCITPALLLLAGLMISGCANSVADHTPTAMGGLPGDAPARPTTPSGYPAVNDVPPARSNTLLSSQDQKNLEDELAQARNRAAAAASAGTARADTGKPAATSARQ